MPPVFLLSVFCFLAHPVQSLFAKILLHPEVYRTVVNDLGLIWKLRKLVKKRFTTAIAVRQNLYVALRRVPLDPEYT